MILEEKLTSYDLLSLQEGCKYIIFVAPMAKESKACSLQNLCCGCVMHQIEAILCRLEVELQFQGHQVS